MKSSKKMWNMKVNPDFYDRLQEVAKITDRPASQLVREAINEKFAKLAEQNPRIAEIVNDQAA
jgi:predicted transcriptional regulator